MTVSPWLTFEKLKELDETVTQINSSSAYVAINSTGTLPNNEAVDSIAIGPDANIASLGIDAICIGSGSANSVNAIAIGTQAQANAQDSIAIGEDTLCNTPGSICIGSTAFALLDSGDGNSIAIGDSTNVTGQDNVALGSNSKCGEGIPNFWDVDFCVAIGYDSSVSVSSGSNTALRGVAIGFNSNVVDVDDAVSIGSDSFATADNAVQIGAGTNSTATTLQYRTVPIANSTGLIVPGPFADDTAAAGGGVGIGNPYYLPGGSLVVRLT